MGNQKLKWTADEETALLAGIEKHGTGKWKIILRDPEFADQLINRSNIDLKDKWRNLGVAPITQGSRDKTRPTTVKEEGVTLPTASTIRRPNANSSSPAASLPRSVSSELNVVDDSCNIVVDTKNAPRYDGMIFEALSTLADANGSDVVSIFNSIKLRHEVPPNFRRLLSSRLSRLAAHDKLLKPLQNSYKIPDQSRTTRIATPKPKETNIKPRQSTKEVVEEAAIIAAYKIVEAENMIDITRVAVEELDKMSRIAEGSELILELAKGIIEQCSSGDVVLLA